MGRFSRLECLKIQFDDDGTIQHLPGNWTTVSESYLTCRTGALMAAVDDRVLLVYGGFYDPGIESMYYNGPVSQVPGGVLFNSGNQNTV